MRPDDAGAGPGGGHAADGGGGRAPLVAATVVAALDDALAEHERWLGRWHRALVCRLAPDPDLIADDLHLATDFGRWYAAHADDPLLQQPAVRDLWQAYADVHGLAKLLAERASEARPVPVGEYDELVRRNEVFRERARRLRDAFRKAVSELDPLTGLNTRHAMMAELAAEAAHQRRVGGQLAVALADIDHFKQVNDTHGHGVGDAVLKAVAGRFLSRLRPTDSLYRYGGEEFLISLPDTNPGTAISVLERLRTALAERPVGLEGGTSLPVTASFGVAQLALDGEGHGDVTDAIERADAALYAAKRAGRDRVFRWTPAMAMDNADDAAGEGGDDGG